MSAPDWYERRHELEPGMVFIDFQGCAVKLDRDVPGDGTRWYVANWLNGWAYYDAQIEPGDLTGEPIPDELAAIEAAIARAKP